MRKSSAFAVIFLLCGCLFAFLLAVHPAVVRPRHVRAEAAKREPAATLGLSDLCLFTEARYTRHLSQADLASAFQDHPMGFEHFPSGSLTRPPVLLFQD